MDTLQTVLALIVFVGLVLVYREFLGSLLRFLGDHPSQAIILIVLYAIVYGQIGNALGIPYLFWNEEPVTRLFAAAASTLLLAVVGVNTYFLIHDERHQVGMLRVESFLDRRSFRWPLTFWERSRDEAETAWELTRFLRLVRLPFLAILVLPAVLPGAWFCSGVPKYAPVVDTLRKPHAWFTGVPDVTRNPWAWLTGVVVWCGGVVFGVVVVKVIIYVAPWVTRKVARPLVAWLSRRTDAVDEITAIGLRKRVTLATFFLVVIAAYALAASPLFYEPDAVGQWLWPTGYGGYGGFSPAFCICALLGIASLVTASMSFVRRRLRIVLVLGAFVWIGLANRDDFKLRFEHISYATKAKLPENTEEKFGDTTPDPHLASNDLALDHWLEHIHEREGRGKPKLVVVCVTGGAIRSGYWSTVVLKRLGETIELDRFHDHVRVIAGSSGGMVGAAYYVAWLRSGREFDLRNAVPLQSLWPVARHMTLRDPLKMLLPFRLGGGDRGIALEQDWTVLRNLRFANLRAAEAEGKLPSLIFSPMMVDDGRRLLISNLDLRRLSPPGQVPRAMAHTRGSALSDKGTGGEMRPYSLTATEYYKMFAEQDQGLQPDPGLLLSTAARMSASFPFISPAVNLPSDPPLRVVDAGYYDNYGVNVAAAWIGMNREWLAENCSGVLLVQIRDSMNRRERLGYPTPVTSAMGEVLKGFQFFTSVTDGILAARVSSSMFRNDAQVAALSDVFAGLTKNRAFFTTAFFENSANVTIDEDPEHWPNDQQASTDPSQIATTQVAMSWYLTVAEQLAMDRAIPSDAAAEKAFGNVDQKTKRVERLNALKNEAFKTVWAPRRQAYLYLQYERAMNYERLQSLKDWWGKDHSSPAPNLAITE